MQNDRVVVDNEARVFDETAVWMLIVWREDDGCCWEEGADEGGVGFNLVFCQLHVDWGWGWSDF